MPWKPSRKLSLLIPSLHERKPSLDALRQSLDAQIGTRNVEVLHLADNREMSIGQKRNMLLTQSGGEYVAFVDDDDMVSEDYLARIMPLLRKGPDVVGISMHVTIDGTEWHPWPIFRHSLQFKENVQWHGNDRTPHHLCPMRRTLAVESRFPDLMWGEDYNFAVGVLPHLKTEEWSGEKPIYFYEYRTKKDDPEVRNGLDT